MISGKLETGQDYQPASLSAEKQDLLQVQMFSWILHWHECTCHTLGDTKKVQLAQEHFRRRRMRRSDTTQGSQGSHVTSTSRNKEAIALPHEKARIGSIFQPGHMRLDMAERNHRLSPEKALFHLSFCLLRCFLKLCSPSLFSFLCFCPFFSERFRPYQEG